MTGDRILTSQANRENPGGSLCLEPSSFWRVTLLTSEELEYFSPYELVWKETSPALSISKQLSRPRGAQGPEHASESDIGRQTHWDRSEDTLTSTGGDVKCDTRGQRFCGGGGGNPNLWRPSTIWVEWSRNIWIFKYFLSLNEYSLVEYIFLPAATARWSISAVFLLLLLQVLDTKPLSMGALKLMNLTWLLWVTWPTMT